MATTAYDTLFENLKNKFIVVNDNCEYTLGAYMRMKANEKTATASVPAELIPVKMPSALVRFRAAVGEKLAVREIPAPEKVIHAFPLRTSFAAGLAALVLCTLTVTFAALSLKTLPTATDKSYVISTVAPEAEPVQTDLTVQTMQL